MVLNHNPWLVLLSLLVAIQGAYVGLSLARELTRRPDHRRLLLAGAAASLATAIWAMHFVGMLAARLPLPINYLVLPTLLSVLVSALFVGVAIYLASSSPASWKVRTVAAVIMGSGIVAMHFTGMLALHGKAMLHHAPAFVVASWIVGVSASGLAIRFAFTDRGRTPLVLASVALGLAISGMHYTAMAGMTLHSMTDDSFEDSMALTPDALAVVVALVAFGLSAVFLLTLVPDHPLIGTAGDFKTTILKAPEPMALAGGFGAGVFDEPEHSPPLPKVAVAVAATVLPVQQHGAVRYLPVGQVYAVKADAHYTWVFDGRDSYFCGLSIAEVEARLNPERFVRVHRSHLAALDRIASLRKSGDGGTALLESTTPYTMPVSRRQMPKIRAALDARN